VHIIGRFGFCCNVGLEKILRNAGLHPIPA
jgi:hypothetical protein